MRQLGGRSPEPEAETLPHAEPQQQLVPEPASLQPHEAQQKSPYSVEVHRVERQPVESSPAEIPVPQMVVEAPSPKAVEMPNLKQEPQELRITEARVEPNLASGRWEELGELPRLEQGHGSRANLEPMPWPPQVGWATDQEQERRSSSFAIVVTVIAAILAIGAILWSGLLRERMRNQDAAMSALQEQNHKLTDALEQEEKAGDTSKPDQAAAKRQPANAPNSQVNASQPKTPSQSSAQPQQEKSAQQSAPAGASDSGKPAQSAQKREGVSVPPPAQPAASSRGSHGTVDANYHPEIVPPYPTSSQLASTMNQPAQSYRAPVPINGSNSASAAPATNARTSQAASAPQPGAMRSSSVSSAPTYNSASNASYANALTQNIETVQTLQRQSTVPLREFHAQDGVPVKVTPGLTVAMQSPDPTRGTYILVVNGVGTSYQLQGRINSPLALTDNVTHKSYQLLILHLAGGQAYGYLRPAQ